MSHDLWEPREGFHVMEGRFSCSRGQHSFDYRLFSKARHGPRLLGLRTVSAADGRFEDLDLRLQ